MTTTLEQAIIKNPSMTKEQLAEFYPTAAEVACRGTEAYRNDMKAEAEKENNILEMLLNTAP